MHPGDVVAGKYRVAAILGRTGGMLLEARHTEFDQRVVIRMLSPHVCDEKELERFRREARTLAKLESEHVARIIDVGTHSDGSFYLVRQHLEGVDLATHISNQGALTLDEAVLYVLQAGEAVQECHSHNILLRELQPAHLFLTKRRGGMPMAKIIDFGTAKLLKDPGASQGALGELTATVMFGMSQYSSPELVRKQQSIDGRTDVWSLGCILYELLAAVPAFSGEMAELMLKITREEPIPLSQLRPDIPQEFDQIISWALAKDKGSRFSSVYAMAHALKPFASAEGQVLIDRIGRLAHTKDGPTVGLTPAISPTSPLSKRPAGSYEMPEEATVLRDAPGYEPESEFEKTAFLPDAEDFGRGSVPPPSGHGSVPPPPGSRPEVSGSWSALAIDPDPLGSPYSASTTTGAYPAQSPTGRQQQKRQRKAAVIAFAASLVLLPVLVMVLVFALRDGSADGAVAQNDPNASDAKVAGSEPTAEVDEDDGAPAAATATASADAPPADSVDESSPPAPPKPTAKFPPPPPSRIAGDRIPPPPPPPPPPTRRKKKKKKKSSSRGGGTGTLVAIAIGGSCSFAVDGAPKGTKSSIRVKVSVGPHTVSCSPPGKATRTQRVNVKDGKPGIASFRL